ncbi:MAG: O-antigen ligase family protein [Bacteroidota bacterium]
MARDIYYFGLLLLAVSLPLSKFTMSIAQFMIAGSWLIGGDFQTKFRRLISSPVLLLFLTVYLMHVAGVLWSEDTSSAWRDVRIKLPLLLLPLLIGTSPKLPMVRFEWVLRAVGIGVLISTFTGFLVHKGVIHHDVKDIRDISIFISHIRLSLLCCISVFIALWFMNRKGPVLESFLWLLAMAWMIYFVMLLQSLTSMLIIALLIAIYMMVVFFRGRMLLIRIFSGTALLVCVFLVVRMMYLVTSCYAIKDSMPASAVVEYTASGRPYVTDAANLQLENGYYVWKRICEEELRQEWNKRSDLKYDGRDNKGHEIRFTLIRFLTSKGLDKDSAAIASLSSKELKAIESGTANVFYIEHSGLTARLHQTIWEYQNYLKSGDPTGHSITQRLEYWKTGWHIFKANWWTGVGTGDLQLEFDRQYEANQSKLTDQWRLRTHNQYLSIGAAFGVFGLMLFMAMLIWPVVLAIRLRDHLYLAFLATAMLSMLSEDTLETQAGVTFFAFFSCLFLFVHPINRYIRVKKSSV